MRIFNFLSVALFIFACNTTPQQTEQSQIETTEPEINVTYDKVFTDYGEFDISITGTILDDEFDDQIIAALDTLGIALGDGMSHPTNEITIAHGNRNGRSVQAIFYNREKNSVHEWSRALADGGELTGIALQDISNEKDKQYVVAILYDGQLRYAFDDMWTGQVDTIRTYDDAVFVYDRVGGNLEFKTDNPRPGDLIGIHLTNDFLVWGPRRGMKF